MNIQEAIKILDEVIPPPHNKMVDSEHIKIAIAWKFIKEFCVEANRQCELVKMKSNERGKEYLACSLCNCSIWHQNEYFCYNCGAKIKRETDNA